MQAKEGVIDLLNGHLTIELTAINQYFLLAEMCRNWGFEGLYAKFRELSMEEMQDAEKLVAHILFLEGLPNMQRLGEVRAVENVREAFDAGLATERAAVQGLSDAFRHCAEVGAYETRGMFEEMVAEEAGHVDWFETQLETIALVGMERYLAQHIRA